MGRRFWLSENRLNAQVMAGVPHNQVFGAPVLESSAIGLEYSRAAAAADTYFELLDKHGIQSWTENPAAYLGGLAHFSIGNYERAALLFSRLDPSYRRDVFIAERFAPEPEFSSPTRPGISKLQFYSQLRALPATSDASPADAFAALQSITREALNTLEAQREYAHWLANRKSIHDRRLFSEGNFGSQPDQRRAEALPPTLLLVEQAWDQLVEPSLRHGAKPVRDYLRSLSTPGAPLEKIALWRLQNLDRLIIAAALKDAEERIARHDFDGGRGILRSLIVDYPNSEAATRAEAAIKASVPIAVKYFREEGDKNWKPRTAVPQTKSLDFYSRMYQENPDGSQSDYALFKWGEALGTDITKSPQAAARLQEFLKKYPDSPYHDQAMYTLGLVYVHDSMKKYAEGVKLLMQVPKQHPQSEVGSEALWMASYVANVWMRDYRTAGEAMQMLHDMYPQSPRWKHTQKWVDWFKKRLAGQATG